MVQQNNNKVNAEIKATIDNAKPYQIPSVTDVTNVQDSNNNELDVTGGVTAGDDGVTESLIPQLSERPRFIVFDDWQKENGKITHKAGVWYFGIKETKEGIMPTQQWICSPLYIEAISFDAQDNNFGRLLRFRNSLKRWREWAMPMEMLRGSGEELRGELLAMGVEMDLQQRTLLTQYIQSQYPKRKVHCALQVGWCNGSFVLPDMVIGEKAAEVIFQSGERSQNEYGVAGSLEGWKTEIAKRAIGNPMLIFALSIAFAAPLLELCNAESGGFHFKGNSSSGKTKGLTDTACSVWGGESYKRTWKTTANGMEGVAAMFNDSLLALDEISECDPRDVGEIVYALGNGRGKQRASRTGNARAVKRWRCMILSNGEHSIETTMSEGGQRIKAGQLVRLPSIPVFGAFGVWDNLHGMTGAAFTDSIKNATKLQHGYVGRAFLEKLTRDKTDLPDYLERIKSLPEFTIQDAEGQVKRVAARFALVAMAGEIATEYGLTGWQLGDAIVAAKQSLNAWRDTLVSAGNSEKHQAIEKIATFLERHGDSRFSDADKGEDSKTIERAGWWRDGDDGRTYLFTASGLREALKGSDFKNALNDLEKAGIIPPANSTGERAKSQRIGGRLIRLYEVNQDKLEVQHES